MVDRSDKSSQSFLISLVASLQVLQSPTEWCMSLTLQFPVGQFALIVAYCGPNTPRLMALRKALDTRLSSISPGSLNRVLRGTVPCRAGLMTWRVSYWRICWVKGSSAKAKTVIMAPTDTRGFLIRISLL